MVISSAKPEDSGRYECVAESTSGHRASLAAQLLVAHDTRIPETSEYPPPSFFFVTIILFIYLFLTTDLVFHLFEESGESEQKECVCERERYIFIIYYYNPYI